MLLKLQIARQRLNVLEVLKKLGNLWEAWRRRSISRSNSRVHTGG